MNNAQEPRPHATILSLDEKNMRKEWYEQNQLNEQHFNNLEMEIRKLASGWLLVALGAIAFLVRGAYVSKESACPLMLDPKVLITIVGLMGNIGLLVLWILDQMVYHRLLDAVFLLGLRMEYLYDFLPPARTMMVLYSRKKGMARYLRLYYLVPMSVLALISVAACALRMTESLAPWGSLARALPIVTAVVALLIPICVYAWAKTVEKHKDVAREFDEGFSDYLSQEKYQAVLKRNA